MSTKMQTHKAYLFDVYLQQVAVTALSPGHCGFINLDQVDHHATTSTAHATALSTATTSTTTPTAAASSAATTTNVSTAPSYCFYL